MNPGSVTETPDLPEGWCLSKIGAACQLNPGKPAANALPPDAPVSFVPMPALDAGTGTIRGAQDRPFHSVRGGYTAFAEGDVLFAKITPCMENGKGAIAQSLTNGLGFGSSEFHVLRPNGTASAEYLFYFVRQEAFRRVAEENMTGSVGQARVPAEFLREYPIPLPPLAEQARIVQAVEGALSHVGAAREKLAGVARLLKRFRQSVLSSACSGKVTADWRDTHPDAEPASVLLERIAEQRRASEDKKYKQPAPPDTADLPELPKTWAWATADTLFCVITSGSRDWTRFYGHGTGTFIMAQNVKPGLLDLTFRQAVNPPEENRDRERSQVAKGDLLVTIVGANTGDVCPVLIDLPEHYVCQSVALMRPDSALSSAYLNLVFNSPEHGQGHFEEFIYGAGRPHLSFDQLKATPIPLPPSAEQAEIVRRVEALFALADVLEKRVAQATARVEKTTQAVLAKAFRGELVPTEAELARQEGRTYESASELLAHLATTLPATKARSRK